MNRRRALLAAGLRWPLTPALIPTLAPLLALRPAHADEAAAERLLRAGGVVAAFRHALAPGTFDPPQFRLGECSTQRNLNDEGRAQSRRLGQWFQARGLQPAAVRSSPWCRCVDTATLAFGRAEAWTPLGSPRGLPEAMRPEHQRQLREALAAASRRAGRFEVWVTHMFVLADLVGANAASGEGLLLRAGADGRPELLARLAVA